MDNSLWTNVTVASRCHLPIHCYTQSKHLIIEFFWGIIWNNLEASKAGISISCKRGTLTISHELKVCSKKTYSEPLAIIKLWNPVCPDYEFSAKPTSCTQSQQKAKASGQGSPEYCRINQSSSATKTMFSSSMFLIITAITYGWISLNLQTNQSELMTMKKMWLFVIFP